MAKDDVEKTSAFNDPRFWVSVTAVLLTLTLFVLTIAINKLSSIDVRLQTVSGSVIQQTEEIKTLRNENAELKAKQKELEHDLEVAKDRQTDYAFALSNRLKEIEVLLKLKREGG